MRTARPAPSEEAQYSGAHGDNFSINGWHQSVIYYHTETSA